MTTTEQALINAIVAQYNTAKAQLAEADYQTEEIESFWLGVKASCLVLATHGNFTNLLK